MKCFLVICLCLFSLGLRAQTTCTGPGQNPWSAFPVCGTGSFAQLSVPLCGGQSVPTPTCNSPLTDINPYWYKFTCFETGTLGFRIQPNTSVEDYDWQLYDVTGQDLASVYTNPNLVVACNWSGEGGTTGASNLGRSVYVCEGLGKPLWSTMPQIYAGHNYLLLVSHFTATQSGYSLAFSGGTAVITDTTKPHLRYVESGCGGLTLRVKLNKKMKCSTLAADGSDFYITPAAPPIVSARGFGCETGFDMDSVELTLAAPPDIGAYTLHVRNGSDNNTLLDYCDAALAPIETADFNILPLLPTPMDSLSPVQCKPNSLVLVFRKSILCSSVASDGSDFTISGSYPVSVISAQSACGTSPGSKQIIVNLDRPLYDAGNFTITLKRGSDGNTILDECTKETPAGSALSFTVKDTVNAAFTYIKRYGCVKDTLYLSHPGGHGVNSWNWQLDEGQTGTSPTPQGIYQVFGPKQVSLTASNGFCRDSSSQIIALDNAIKAAFDVYDDICPNEPVQFTSQAQGIRLQHAWSFGDGATSAALNPVHNYPPPFSTIPYTIQYKVTDSVGCSAAVQKIIHVYASCYLAVPTAFTPNNDGLNDLFGPLNAIKAENLEFRVYNRWGQLVYQTRNWKQPWDGNFKGLPQPTATYVWFLSFTDRDSRQSRQMKGTVVLIR